MSKKPRAAPSRRARPWVRLGLLLLSSLVAGEVAVRALAREGVVLGRPLPPWSAVATPAQREWLARQQQRLAGGDDGRVGGFDRELGWDHFPGRAVGGTTINGLGARSVRAQERQPPADRVRVVCYGDSFTLCADVGDADTWQVELEGLEPRIDAVNMGVGGYGLDQALLRFRRFGTLGARVVCVGLMLENIGRHLNRYRPAYYPRAGACLVKPRFVLGRDGDLQLVPIPFADERAWVAAVADGSVLQLTAEHEGWRDGTAPWWGDFSHLLRAGRAWRLAMARRPRALWADPAGEGRALTLALIRAFVGEVAGRGADAVLVLFPSQEDARGLCRSGDHYWQPILAGLADEGIESVDVGPALRHRCAATGRDIDALFTGSHLNGEGNDVVAAAVLQALRARLPQLR